MQPDVSVGFVGVGDMGGRIVKLLAAGGLQQVLWARRPEALEEYAELPNVRIAPSLADIGAGASVVGVCVWGESDIDEVVREFAPQMAPGSAILIHSTVSAAFCEELARTLARRGIRVVDAPVSTRLDADKLLVLAGGDPEAFAACRVVLEAMGDPVVHLGPLGSGQRAKLLNNTLMAAHVALADDALRIGSALDLDPELLGGALLYGSSSKVCGMQMFRILAAMAPDDPSNHPARDWAWKDVGSMLAEVERSGNRQDALLLSAARAGARVIAGDEPRDH